MRAETFVPGHISCIFRPVRGSDFRETGSLGLGIRLDLGCRASAAPSDGDMRISINGETCEAPITRSALEFMGVREGFDISLIHELPIEQGFATSASGTYAASLCVAELTGKDPGLAAEASHYAECTCGGGLGDLLAICSPYGVPIREAPGMPGTHGRTADSGLSLDRLSLIVFEDPLNTGSVLSDESEVARIIRAGDDSLRAFRKDPTVDRLFEESNRFSEEVGLQSPEVTDAIGAIRSLGYHAGMSMLGNSVYSDAPVQNVRDLFPNARIFESASYGRPVEVTRRE
jgi:pantoate kinase